MTSLLRTQSEGQVIEIIKGSGLAENLPQMETNPDTEKSVLSILLRFKNLQDFEVARVMEAIQEGDGISLNGKSGHAQVGIDTTLDLTQTPEYCSDKGLTCAAKVSSLATLEHSTLLSDLIKEVDEKGNKNIHLGPLLVTLGATPLSRGKIHDAIEKKDIWIPEQADINPDGTIDVPLQELQYILSDILLKANTQKVWEQSRRSLGKIRDESPNPMQTKLKPKEFFVGALRVSVGPYIFEILREQNPNVFHLAARIFESLRTTGKNSNRHIEIFNYGDSPLTLENFKVKMRVYPDPNEETQRRWKIIARTKEAKEKILNKGVQITDFSKMGNPDFLPDFFKQHNISETKNDSPGSYGVLIDVDNKENPVQDIPWDGTEIQQQELIQTILSGKIQIKSNSNSLDDDKFLKLIKYIGGAQTPRRIFASHAFPSSKSMDSLESDGVGIFLARDLNLHTDDFRKEPLKRKPLHNVYFSSAKYDQFVKLTRDRNAQIYKTFSIEDKEVLYEFYKGLWVEPKNTEKIDKIENVIALYGSHNDQVGEALQPQLDSFAEKINTLFTEKSGAGTAAFVHGKGSGVMLAADKAARKNKILSIGYGIDVEKIKPANNFATEKEKENENDEKQVYNSQPDAMVDFDTRDGRGKRQGEMDKISNFRIFNLGGLGTLEEMAITLTNMKLKQSIMSPCIFVDPSNNGEHLWANLIKQVRVLIETEKIEIDDGVHTISLLQKWAGEYLFTVKNYDEAYEKIAEFVNDPAEKWKKWGIPTEDLAFAYKQTKKNAKERNFKLPSYLTEAAENYNLAAYITH